jgi:hypothetical protein
MEVVKEALAPWVSGYIWGDSESFMFFKALWYALPHLLLTEESREVDQVISASWTYLSLESNFPQGRSRPSPQNLLTFHLILNLLTQCLLILCVLWSASGRPRSARILPQPLHRGGLSPPSDPHQLLSFGGHPFHIHMVTFSHSSNS